MEQLNKNPKEFADIKDVKLDDAYHRRFWGFNLGFRQAQCAAGQYQDFEILEKPESSEKQLPSESKPQEEEPKKSRCSWFRSHYCRKNRQNDATLSDQVNDLKPQFVSMEGVAANFSDLPEDKKQQLYEQWQRHFRFDADGQIHRSYPQFSAYRISHQHGFRCRLGKNYKNEIPVGNYKPWVGWDFKRDQF